MFFTLYICALFCGSLVICAIIFILKCMCIFIINFNTWLFKYVTFWQPEISSPNSLSVVISWNFFLFFKTSESYKILLQNASLSSLSVGCGNFIRIHQTSFLRSDLTDNILWFSLDISEFIFFLSMLFTIKNENHSYLQNMPIKEITVWLKLIQVFFILEAQSISLTVTHEVSFIFSRGNYIEPLELFFIW